MASTVTTMVAEAFDHVSSMLDAPFAKAFVLGVPVSGHLVVEAILLATVFLLLLQKSYKPPKRPLTEQEIDQLCDDWVPEPLHPPITNEMSHEPPVLESAAGPHTIVDGKDTLNFSSGNYLGLIGHAKLTECCTASLEKYGVGACGPRGFYGTIDTHLDCEAKIASFLGTPDSILYSYGVSATFSTIPAFCKRGDIIVADEGVNWGIRKGLHLSRSTVEFFKHNDMSSLETILQRVTKGNKQLKKLRRYIVVEGIYQNSGQIAPLDEIIRLKEKYLFRVLLEESNSFGVLGRSGRGLSEHFNVPVSKIDIITASMANSLATDGGFCTGSARVVDYQRLSSSGYVFSASLPPYLASAAITAIDLLVENPHLREKLRDNISLLWKGLSDIPELVIASNPLSPVIFLKLKNSSGSFKDDLKVLEIIVERMLKDECVLLASVRRSFLDRCALPAGLRLCISAAHSEDDILKVTGSLKRVVRSVIYNE